MKLTAENVEHMFKSYLRDAGTPIDGIVSKAILDTTGKEQEISDMLADLPNEFQSKGGGGWSFLNACTTRDGEQWTGMHRTMERLFLLGIAAGKARWLMPREMWSVLPGGMPYVSVN